MTKAYFAVQAIGKDRPGIVAAITEVLVRFECNVEMSQMTILGGHFSTTLIASGHGELDSAELEAELVRRVDSAVQTVYVSVLDAEHFRQGGREPSHRVLVEAAEQAAILHRISTNLAEKDVNIAYLASKSNSTKDAVAMDVVVPQGVDEEELERIVRAAVGRDVSVDVAPAPQSGADPG